MRRSPKPWVALLLAAAACGVDGGGDPIVGEARVRPGFYDYTLDLETREARAELTLRVEAAGDCFEVPMRSEGLRDVRVDGIEPRELDYDGARVRVCGPGWPEGGEVLLSAATTVPLETWRDSQVGYSVTEDIEGKPFRYLVSWVGGCDRFGPCESQPNAFATYRFTVDHPRGEQVLCPGEITAGETRTTCTFEHRGGPTYSSFGLAASSSWEQVSLGNWGGIDVTFYDLPSAGLASKLDVEEHKSFLAWMVESFGPYPYGSELRFAAGPTYWNGFEHPGNIVLNERLTTGGFQTAFSNPLAHTTSHEIAHQWAGNQTTLASTYDFVWKEAMAEYLVFVHQQEQISEVAAARSLNAWKQFANFSEYYLVPADAPELIDYYGDVYGPGPMILFRQLEALFDRASVLRALSELLGQERAIGIDDVQTALEDATGADLGNYFDAWVHGQGAPSWPLFAVTTDEGADGLEIQVRQEKPEEGLFGCAFDLVLRGAGDETLAVRVDLGVDGTAEWSTVAAPTFEVVSIDFDPRDECLARQSTAGARAPSELIDPGHPWVAR